MSQNQNTNQTNINNQFNNDNKNFAIPNNYMMNYSAYTQNIPPFPPYGSIPYPNLHQNFVNQNQNQNKQNQIILIPAQSPITQINQNNSTHPTLLGNALIPVLNERQISASQKYYQIVIIIK